MWDEAGFSLSPNRCSTWAPLGETPILLETPGRQTSSGIGFITISPQRRDLDFRYTLLPGSMSWDDCHDLLRQLYFFYRRKVVLLWDNPPLHYCVAEAFVDEHPTWFDFQYFPTYSPELNPVEQCWQWIKKVELANFLPNDRLELTLATCAAAQKINQSKTLLHSFFKHAGISL